MSRSTINSKGQITLPPDDRQALCLAPGDKIEFVITDGDCKLVPLRHDVTSLKGRFARRVKRPVTTNEMDEAIACAAIGSVAE